MTSSDTKPFASDGQTKPKLAIAGSHNHHKNIQQRLSSVGDTSLQKDEKSNVRIPLSPAENLTVGAISGALDMCLCMPIISYKFCLQEGRSLPTTISGWYRGVGVQAGTVAPITAIQFCANGVLQKLMRMARHGENESTKDVRALTESEMMLTSAGAGAISALVYSPVDLLTIQQQKLDKNLMDTGRTLMKEYGLSGLYRGLGTCITREVVYTAGYLGLAPVLSARLVKDSSLSERPFLAGILGACIAGTAAGIITHPVDTVKTCIQSDMTGKVWSNFRSATPLLIREGGVSSLFNGMTPRTVAICGSFFVCMTLQDLATEFKTRRAHQS